MAQQTIKVGPDNWTEAVPLLLIAYRDATPQGKKQAEQEIKNMAKVADLVPGLVAALKTIVFKTNASMVSKQEKIQQIEAIAKKALQNIQQ